MAQTDAVMLGAFSVLRRARLVPRALYIGYYVFVLSDLERAVLSAHQHHIAKRHFVKLRKIGCFQKIIDVIFLDPFQLVSKLKQRRDLMLAQSRAVAVTGELPDFAVLIEELDCMMTSPLHDRFACAVIKAEIHHAEVIVDILILARVDVSLPRFGLIEKDRAVILSADDILGICRREIP